MPPEPEGPDSPDEPVTQVVETADLVEDTTAVRDEVAAAPPPFPPAPPAAPHAAGPPPSPPPPPSPRAAAAEEVEELDADELTEQAPEVQEDGVLEAAVAGARATRAEGGRKRRIAFYETELEAITRGEPDKARQALYQHEIGEVLESAGDEGAAVKAYAKALQSDATLKPNLWAIRRVFQGRALWPNLLKLLDAEIRFASTDSERAELLVEKGQLLEDRLERPADARECFVKATEVFPSSVPAWMALEKITLKQNDAAGLVGVLRGLASATAEPARKVALLLDLARLDAERGALDEALALCREAYLTGAEPERALDELERLAEPAGRTEDRLWALEARALLLLQSQAELGVAERLQVTDRLVALRRRQAQLAQELLADPTRAFGYLEEAAKIAPSEPLLERDLAELAELLGRWDDLAGLLLKRLENASPVARLRLQLERADALRRAGKPVDADAVEAEVAREAPHHLGLLVAREREALRAGDWDRLASLYLAEGELAASDRTPTGQPDPIWAATAFAQAGTLYGDKSGRDAEAQAALERALNLVPGFRLAVDALDRSYTRSAKHAERAALLEKELEGAPPARARRLYETLIAVRESGLDDFAGAALAARRLVELRPDDVRVRLRLIELDRAGARFAELAEDLAGLAKILPEDRRLEVLLERADVLERRVGDDAAAQAVYKEALALRPGESRAVEGFETLSRRRSGSKSGRLPDAPGTSPPAWDELAQALRREAEASLSPDRIAAVLLKLGEIHERERGNFEDAAQTYRDLLDRSPGHGAALRGLQRAYLALGSTHDQRRAEAAEHELEAIGDPGSQVAALTQLGELYEDRLKDDAQAEDAFDRALAAGPAVHAALGRFRTHVRRRDPAALVESLTQLSGFVGDSDEPAGVRSALLDERAAAQRAAGEREAALLLVRSALAESTGVSPSPRLQRARLAATEPAELSDALDALAASGSDPAVQSTLARRAGLLALGLGPSARAQAVKRLQQAQALAPSEPEALVSLCDVIADPDALALRAALAEGPAQLDWMLERAEALEALGRIGEAAKEAERVLHADPRHLAGLELARRLAKAGGDDGGYARATVRLAGEVQDAERAATLHAQAGRMFEKVGMREEAAAAWRAVLDRTPLDGASFNRARALLSALHEEKKQPGPLVELYTHRLAHVQDAGDRVAILIDRAELLQAENDREGAERDLRAVLALSADHVAAMRRLAELLGVSPLGRAEALALLGRYLDLETATEHRRAALLRMAELEEAPGGKPEEAVHHLEQAIELAPSPAASVRERERLAELLTRQRQWQRAVQVLNKIAELVPDGERAGVEIRIATIYKDGFSDPRAAVEALNRALKSQPLELDALAKMVQLAEAGHVVLLELDDRLERAIAVARLRVAADPSQPEPYQALSRLWGWRGDDDARAMAAQAVALVTRQPPPAPDPTAFIDPSKELTPQGWERILADPARSVALEVWRLATEGSIKLYGPAPETLGVGKSDRVNPKALPPQWAHVDKIARALGCGAAGYELYAAKDKDTCELAGAALVCGSAFAERLPPGARFRVARKVALLRDRLGPLERLDDEELTLFFAACAKVAELPRPASLKVSSEAKLDERAKALGKALGRKERKGLQALGARFSELPEPWAWRRAILDGALRLALVVAGDLGAALDVLALTITDPRARELISFAMSEDCVSLRRELGLRT